MPGGNDQQKGYGMSENAIDCKLVLIRRMQMFLAVFALLCS